MLIESKNRDLVHHVLMYECDPQVQFDDSNLPHGLCDDMGNQTTSCLLSIATGWAVGGDDVRLNHDVEFRDDLFLRIDSRVSTGGRLSCRW